MPEKESLSTADVTFSTLKNEGKGIALGSEKLFVVVSYDKEDHKGKMLDRWSLRLLDLEENRYISKEFSVNDVDDLRVSTRETKGFRAALKDRYKNWEHIIEMVLIQIDENKTVWKLEETDKKETKEVTEQDKAIASKLLADPKLLDYALAIGKKRLIGEDNLLKQNIIFIVSGQTRYPLSEIITGYSGSGKNESIRAVSPLFPEGWIFEFTTSTPEAIKYIPEEFSGTLIIYELAGIRSETGSLGLRSIGEGKGIKTIYPTRDEATGKMALGETQTNAKNFISTDSGLDIATDLYRRVFKNSMNDSLALTKRVCAKKIRDSSIPESLRAKLSPEQNKTLYSENDFKKALALLDLNLEVVLFPLTDLLNLIDLANKKEQQVALRTQIERILNVIKILALVHQKQRIKLTVEENSYIIADVGDVEIALTILETSIIETVTRIEKRQKEALELFEKWGGLKKGLNKNQLAVELNCSTVTAAKILKTLANNGYLKQNESVKPYSYELPDEERRLNPLGLSEMTSKYKANYLMELKTFLTGTLSTCHEGLPQNISIEIPEELKTKYGIARTTSDKVQIGQEPKPIQETKVDSLVFSERISKNEVENKTPLTVLTSNPENSTSVQALTASTENQNITIPVFEGNGSIKKPEPYHGRGLICPECAAKGKTAIFYDKGKLEAHRNEHGVYDGKDKPVGSF